MKFFKKTFNNCLKGILLTLASVMVASNTLANHLNVVVSDAKGKKQDKVVVFLEPQFKQANNSKPANILIDQRDKEFIPFVTAVQVGTAVRFPNHDKIRHHVYSFSKPKSFQIPLYKDVEPKPIVFDKAGVVPLGCNIHDWMNAFVFVSKSPYFAVSDPNGTAKINNLPNGKYIAKLYHPSMKNWESQSGKTVQVNSNMPTLSMTLEKKKKIFRSFRPPTGGASAYR